MTNNQPFDNQLQMFGQMAQQSGISGAAYIDVDLALSTKTCLKYLYPLLQPGGVIFTQDGHLPLVIKVLDNDDFWENEVGYKKPIIKGLYREKLVKIIKPKGAKRILKNKK